MATDVRISPLEETKTRKSRFTLDEIIHKISGIQSVKTIKEGMPVSIISDEVESILCLAHEIKEIKEFLKMELPDKIQD